MIPLDHALSQGHDGCAALFEFPDGGRAGTSMAEAFVSMLTGEEEEEEGEEELSQE